MDRQKLNPKQYRKGQQGFILLTSLVFIIVLTVIVISTVDLSTSDEKIARNSRDKDIAFAAAEAALRDAEIYISGSYQFPYTPSANSAAYIDASNHLDPGQSNFFVTGDPNYQYTCAIGANGPQCLQPVTNSINTNITKSPQIAGVANQPRYLIDIVRVPPSGSLCNNATFVFRITAQAQGRDQNTISTLQELFCPP